MAVNVPVYANGHALERCFKLVCRVLKQWQTLGIHMFVDDFAVMVILESYCLNHANR
jgi:hypothetical protein